MLLALQASGVFNEEELRVALEVIDAGLDTGLDGDYPLFAAEVEGRARGYVCVGKTPLTHATWHLYWICVHPESQGMGIGQRLQDEAERFVHGRGGERILLETSSTPGYAASARVLRSCRLCRRRTGGRLLLAGRRLHAVFMQGLSEAAPR